MSFNVWDLGGQTSIRPYWRCYYANTAAVVFVIDSTDVERLAIASGELRAMLDEEELRDAALLVFANKQDQPGARGAGEISEALKLGELKDRNWSIMACSAIDGRGVTEGMDWLVVSFPSFLRGYGEVGADLAWRGVANGWRECMMMGSEGWCTWRSLLAWSFSNSSITWSHMGWFTHLASAPACNRPGFELYSGHE